MRGGGAKGPRWYDWAWIRLPYDVPPGWRRWLLARRSIEDPTELAYYRAYGPAPTSLQTLVHVAGARWSVEQCLEEAKGETGLDQYQVRTWRSWHRHVTLALLAHAFLAWLRQTAGERGGKGGAGVGRGVGAGGAAALGGDPAAAPRDARTPAGLVHVAASASTARQTLPLPPSRRRPHPLTTVNH
ncbi:MAG: hypothetical protein NVS2B16_38000 [Chloroflexota bacterium]